jgi:hypothetical protein
MTPHRKVIRETVRFVNAYMAEADHHALKGEDPYAVEYLQKAFRQLFRCIAEVGPNPPSPKVE